MQKIPLIAVVGPTASGKTGLGIELALEYGGEVISADSMQIYKGISIASAAPNDSETRGIKHHLVEFLNREDSFSVADYVNLADKTICDVFSRGKQPILVGGTGLYVNSLVDGIEFIEQETDIKLRTELEEEMEKVGAEEMLRRLSVFDPEAAEKLHPNNRRRIVRAFEVYKTTGITQTQQNAISRQKGSKYNSILIGITYYDRDILYNRINTRVEKMLESGLLEEAKTTLTLSIGEGAMQAIGHKELHRYLRGEVSLQQAVETLKTETRRYAKRQLTWFNKRDDINWIYADREDVLERAKEIINRREINE